MTYDAWKTRNRDDETLGPEPDDDEEQSFIDPGPCCCCERPIRGVVNILMLDLRAPIAGTGWGCATCDLPPDGAIAVVCLDCLGLKPRFVVNGFVGGAKRTKIGALGEPRFAHDAASHLEDFAEEH